MGYIQMDINILDFGAIGDGLNNNTSAIQQAIDTASELHATVVIPDGVFRSGSVFLRKNMKLRFLSNAVLLGSQDLSDYVICKTRFEGRCCIWPLALLNAQELDSVVIEGDGIIDGNGFPFWRMFWDEREKAIHRNAAFSNRDVMRPRLLFVEDCRNVSISGITLRNSAFWNMHLYRSSGIIIENVRIEAPHEGIRAASSDAIDIDACSNVRVSGCYFSTDDDCVCLKGGKGREAHLENRPTENVVIEHCTFGFGHGVLTLGSEACRINNVVIKNCIVDGENSLVRVKFRDDTDQVFSNIVFEDIEMNNGGWLFDVRPWVSRQDEILASGLPSVLRNMIVRRVKARNMISPGILDGGEQVKLEGIKIEAVEFTSRTGRGGLCRADEYEQQDEAIPGELRYSSSADIAFSAVTIDGMIVGNQAEQ